MATYANAVNATYTAGSAVSQHRFVTLDGNGKVNYSTNGVDGEGVSVTSAAADGDIITVQEYGRAIVEVGTGGVTVGDKIAADTNGVAITAAVADITRAIALETGAVNSFVAVRLVDGGNAN